MTRSQPLYRLATGIDGPRERTPLRSFLINTTQNRLLYWLSKHHRERFDGEARGLLDRIHDSGRAQTESMKRTLDAVEDVANSTGLDYIVAKLDRSQPYISCDVDLLVQESDFDRWIAGMKEAGFTEHAHRTFVREQVVQRILRKPGHVKVDLTCHFNWQHKIYFDREFLWDGYDAGTHRMSAEADFVVNLATVTFKRMSFNLIDYLYLREQRQRPLDWNSIEEQTTRYHWSRSYREALEFLDSIDPEVDRFPRMFPASLVSTVFREKLRHGDFSLNYFTYFVLARARYYLLGRRHLPFHVYWFPRRDLESVGSREVEL